MFYYATHLNLLLVSTYKKVSINARSYSFRQLREGNLFAEQCPSREVLKHVTSRWGVLILVALRDGTHRFSDLRRKMGGVSEKMLAQSLQALEQDGFLNRVSYPVVPPHVEYSLTPLGEQVSDKVAALADWIELNLPQVLAQRDRLSDGG
ncbi:Redox-sensing transcriptional regulator QorR [Salmonella enterica subsp. enterica]|uniref:Redox-sensing transcriptional regulator QorR n=3 Tax=Enterobacteriaceae TaxID=543 RepID=A0A447PPP3_SALET|nr:Redox-sensing transcriptional regulator QorR [Salmonella enterica subsp. enterica]